MSQVDSIVDDLLEDLTEEERKHPKLFPVWSSRKVDKTIYQDLLNTEFSDLVPKVGEDLRISTSKDAESYWGKVKPVYFDPEWSVRIRGEKWGPYKDGSDGFKQVLVRWDDPISHTFVWVATTNKSGQEINLADAIIGPISGFGLSRGQWMMHYAETGYEGHYFKSSPDPGNEFIDIVLKHLVL